MDDLSEFQRDILYVCAGMENPYGLGIKEELDQYYGSEVTPSRVYMNLDTLAEKGLIDVRVVDNKTKNYTLTAEAREQIEKRRQWENQQLK